MQATTSSRLNYLRLVATLCLVLSIVIGAAIIPSMASAQITNPAISASLGSDVENASSGQTFLNYFILLWRAIITVGALVVLVYFLWGALEWILAGGDSGKIQKARDRITQSIIGMVILAGSFTIIAYISSVFFPNFDLLRLTLPTPEGSSQPSVPKQAPGQSIQDRLERIDETTPSIREVNREIKAPTEE